MLTPSYFRWSVDSHDVRPVDGLGAAVTPAQNAKGSWATVLAGGSVTNDVWEITVQINNADVTAISRDLLVDIGIDTGGGFTVLIPDLLASYAGPYISGGHMGIRFKFPLHIPSGAAIGARASVNNANLAAIAVSVKIAGDPLDPKLHWKGAFVRAYGITAATSNGTAVTPGQEAEGAWVDLGALADDIYYWQLGAGADDSTLGGLAYHHDLGVGPSNPPARVAVLNLRQSGTTTEQWSRSEAFPAYTPGTTAASDHVWARSQCSGVPDSVFTMAAYGVGGDGGNTAVGGGSDSTDPVENPDVGPDDGVPPGGSGFPTDYTVAKVTPIQIDITDPGSGIGEIVLEAKFTGDPKWIGVYKRGAFVEPFNLYSTKTSITDGFRLSIRHNDGWPPGDGVNTTVSIDSIAIDKAGNVT